MSMECDGIPQGELERRLLSCIAGRMPFAAKPGMDSDLFDDLGFDSGLLLDLIIAIEAEFNLRFSGGELTLEALRSPQRILDLIRACRRRDCGQSSREGD